MHNVLPLAALSLFACAPGGEFQGKLVDGMTGEPRSVDLRVLAKADSTDMTCRVKEAIVDGQGAFHLEDLCAADSYVISLSDPQLMMTGISTSVSGAREPTGPMEIQVWRAPTAMGVFKLENDALKGVKTFSDVDTVKTKDGELTVRYPESKPVKLAGSQKIVEGSHLVVRGKQNIDNLKVYPLVEDSEKRGFFEGATIEDHVWIGVKFASDSEYEEVSATFDESKVTTVGEELEQTRYIAHDALPTGRYALLGEEDKRTYILDFGAGAAAPAEPAPEEDGG